MVLTAKQRELFVMMYEGGGTIAQISQVLSFPPDKFAEVRRVNDIPLRIQNMKRIDGKVVAPDGMLHDAKRLALPELMSKYQLGRKVVMTILRDHGVQWIDGEEKRLRLGVPRHAPLVQRSEHVQSAHDRAAHHLRRYCSNVHRCDIKVFEHQRVTWGDLNNVPDHGVGYYYVDGHGVVTMDAMLKIARDRGFTEDAGSGY